ncbi:MAG: Ig-like domain-containing protein [Anaerolineales bacterium]
MFRFTFNHNFSKLGKLCLALVIAVVVLSLSSARTKAASPGDGEQLGVSAVSTTKTTITKATPNPSIPGQSVLVSVTVKGKSKTPAPTGTVLIFGADTDCTITLVAGSGNCTVVFDTPGTWTLVASYSGDTNYPPGLGKAKHSVNKGPSTTTINGAIPDRSVPGQAVVVSVTVSGAGTTPTGTVTIKGADINCSLTLSGGSGSCSVIFNTAGVKTLKATYHGDGNYASSSGSAIQFVQLGSSTTYITAESPDPSFPSQAVSLSVQVVGGGVRPTGTVNISGADINCTIRLSGGTGSCNVVFNTIGLKTITAYYNGDGNYLPGLGTISHSVKNASIVTLTAEPDPATLGSSASNFVLVTVTVSGPGVTPTGTVDITGTDNDGSGIPLDSTGTARWNVWFLTAGPHTITATYNGDANYVPSSGTTSDTVLRGTPTVTITGVSPEPSVSNQLVEVSVSVTGSGVTPTGYVAISLNPGQNNDCTIVLADESSCGVVITNPGQVTGQFSVTITATYGGDGNYQEGSTYVIHTVN